MKPSKLLQYLRERPTFADLSVTRESIDIFLMSKFLVMGSLLLLFYSYPNDNNLWNRWYSQNIRAAAYLPFANWDAQHYLLLGDFGYARVWQHSIAFYPLFPTIISLIKPLTGNVIIAALLITLSASCGSIVYLYHYASHYLPRTRARWVVLFTLAFPPAFFLSVFYAEGLFLLALFGFLYSHDVQRKEISILWAFILPLIKGQGFFIGAGFTLYVLWHVMRIRRDIKYELLNMLGFLGGMGLYFTFYLTTRGDYLAGLKAQKTFVTQLSSANLFDPVHLYQYLMTPSSTWFAYNNGLIDKIFLVLMVGLFYYVVKARRALHIIFYSTLVYPSIAMGLGASFSRYTLIAFPLAVIGYFKSTGDRPIKLPVCCLLLFSLFLTQLVFIYRYATNQWAG